MWAVAKKAEVIMAYFCYYKEHFELGSGDEVKELETTVNFYVHA